MNEGRDFPREPDANESASPSADARDPSERVRDKRHSHRAAEPAAPVDPEVELAKARQQAAEHLDDLKRLKAEFENYRKRILKEQTNVVEMASRGVVERMLGVLDNFALALMAADRTKDYEALVKGVEMVFGELMDLLHKEGLQRIDALGKPFDPEMHEAVLGEGPADGEPFVAEVMRDGYTLKGRVLRPAMVKVVRR